MVNVSLLFSAMREHLNPPLTLTEPPKCSCVALEQEIQFASLNSSLFLCVVVVLERQEIPTLALSLSQPQGTLSPLATPSWAPSPHPLVGLLLQPGSPPPSFPPSPALSHTHPLFIFLPPSGPC